MLDSYHYHMMASVVGSIQNFGVEVEHILGGCTSLCQPVDVGINRSLTTNICKDWEDWMLDLGISVSTIKALTRKLIGEWVMKAYNNISVEVVVNSWKHGAYTWFDCNEIN